MDSLATQAAFAHCERMAREHYENFPVASLMLPRAKRKFVAAIYAFARTADDYADEGSLTAPERLALLDAWEKNLLAAAGGQAHDPIFVALAETMSHTGLPVEPLRDLLTAFRMDVSTKRYASFDDLLCYCSHSANPVGRIVLHLLGETTAETVALSDNICTGLQLANFWQDLSVDWYKGRLYVPLEDLCRFGYNEQQLDEGVVDDSFRTLMKFQVDRTKQLLVSGMPLPALVGFRLRWELKATIRGGLGIVRRIEEMNYDVLHARPALRAVDKARILIEAILNHVP
jgi:squalene synthase HpnC